MTNTAKALQTVKPTVTTPKSALTVVKGTENTTKKAEKLEQKPTAEQPAIAPKQLSFEERKEKSERLYDLFERHGKLKEHANELLGTY